MNIFKGQRICPKIGFCWICYSPKIHGGYRFLTYKQISWHHFEERASKTHLSFKLKHESFPFVSVYPTPWDRLCCSVDSENHRKAESHSGSMLQNCTLCPPGSKDTVFARFMRKDSMQMEIQKDNMKVHIFGFPEGLQAGAPGHLLLPKWPK